MGGGGLCIYEDLEGGPAILSGNNWGYIENTFVARDLEGGRGEGGHQETSAYIFIPISKSNMTIVSFPSAYFLFFSFMIFECNMKNMGTNIFFFWGGGGTGHGILYRSY